MKNGPQTEWRGMMVLFFLSELNQFIDSYYIEMEIYFPFSRSLATQVLRDGLNCFMLASLFSKYESMTRRLLAIQVAWEVAWKNLSNHSGRAYFSMGDKMLFNIYLKCAYFISQLTHSDPSKGISRQLLGFNKMGLCHTIFWRVYPVLSKYFKESCFQSLMRQYEDSYLCRVESHYFLSYLKYSFSLELNLNK